MRSVHLVVMAKVSITIALLVVWPEYAISPSVADKSLKEVDALSIPFIPSRHLLLSGMN